VRSPGAEGDYIEGAIASSSDLIESVLDRLPDEGWTVLDTSHQAPAATAAEIRALADQAPAR
jgi:hypothetical protein